MKIQPGVFIVAARPNPAHWLGFHVKHVVGPIKGQGIAVISEYDQLVVVRDWNSGLVAGCLFITDSKSADAIMGIAGMKLVDEWPQTPKKWQKGVDYTDDFDEENKDDGAS